MSEATNETLVSLKIEADMSALKKTIEDIKSTIKSALKTSIDLTFNVRGEKQIEAMKKRIAKEIKIPVSFKDNLKAPTPQAPASISTAPPVPQSGVSGILLQMKDVQAQLSAGISGAVLKGFAKGLAGGIIQSGSQFENLKTVISNALGGAAEGAAAMEVIKETANEIKLSIDEVGTGFNKLINRGIKVTKQEFIKLTDVAKSQGKSVDQYIEAVLDAMTGENERLKEFGIKAKDAGDSWIYTFKGVSTQVKKNEKDIYNYMVSLGLLPGVMGMSAKAADTFNGKLDTTKSMIESIKITVFQKISETLKPAIDVLNKILDKIKKWVEENPQLASTLTLLIGSIAALVGTFLTLTPVIVNLLPSLGTALGLLTGSISWVVLAVLGLVAVFWDLWNGFTTGNSIVANLIAQFLQWLGIMVTTEDVINFLKEAFDNLVSDITLKINIIIETFKFFIDYTISMLQGWADFIAVVIDIIVALFTGNIPRAAEGFERLKDAAMNIFDRMVIGALEAVKKILGAFKGLMDRLASLPVVGEYVKGGSAVLEGVLGNIERIEAKKRSNVNERGERINKYARDGKKVGSTQKKNKKNNVDMFGKMPGGTGGGSGTGGGKKGKKPKKGGGAGKNKANENGNTEEQKAIVSAIETLQDVLKKTGYDITSEIKRADLFEAKRRALLDTQKKDGIMEFFNHFKDKFVGANKNETNNKVEIFLNGANGYSKGINENTRIKDLWKIQNSRSGG